MLNLFKKIAKDKIILKMKYFKDNNTDYVIYEDEMIDKKGKYVGFIVTYIKDSKLGIIRIFNEQNSDEKVLFIVKDKKMHISDIRIFKSKNRGIGTKVISILEKVALELKCYTIEGELSHVDLDHRDRQLHFYNKNGFEVRDNSLKKCLLNIENN